MTPPDGTVIAGLVIPSTSPVFLAGVGVHVAAGLTCVIAGAGAMLSNKRRGRHSTLGSVYYWALAVVVGTAVMLAAVRWTEDRVLATLAILAFATATFGRESLRRGWFGRYRPHIACMGASYIVLLTGFYVDNGKSLPIWKDLPAVAYWIAPSLLGAPVIVWALLRHRLARRSISN
jgi:lysylphosphatidylglycerol synthetase-like protein (DUF2156 family)